jgi:hypothetical protein
MFTHCYYPNQMSCSLYLVKFLVGWIYDAFQHFHQLDSHLSTAIIKL